MSDRPRRGRNTATFNTACPIHKRRCKCSFRRPLDPQKQSAHSTPQPTQSPNHRPAHAAQLVASFVQPFGKHLPEPYYAWLAEAATTSSTSKALNKSLLALSLAHVARSKEDPGMWHRAELAYTDALVHLQRDISDSDLVEEDATLAACLIVGRYQDFNRSVQPDHVAAHVLGILRMIQHRGPDSFRKSLLARKLLGYLLPAAATFAIFSGTAPFFSEEKWKAITTRVAPPDDPAYWWYEVHNLTVALAVLRSRQRAGLSRDEVVDLRIDARALVTSLRLLLQRLPFSKPKSMPTSIAFPELGLQKPFTESLRFESGFAAILTIDVWAILSGSCLLLHQTLQRESRDSASPTSATETPEAEPYGSLALEYAVRVCRSVQYIVEENPTMFGRLSLVLPLPLAAQALAIGGADYVDSIVWIQLVLARITQGLAPDTEHDLSMKPNSEALSDYWAKYEQLNISVETTTGTP